MTEHGCEMLDIYIDESYTTINGNPVLIYSLAIPKNLEDPIKDWVEVKERYNIGKEVELKWALKHPDPKLKAEIKDEMISRLARGFLCMVSITKGRDKDLAFTNALRQAAAYARERKIRFLNVYYDKDAYANQQVVRNELDSWTDLYCTTLASLDSRYSVAIQFADILAGAFNYMINVAFGKPAKQVDISTEGIVDNWEVSLDNLFRMILRFSIWGRYPNQSDSDIESFQEEINCFGSGIMVHGDFTDEERKIIEDFSWFYLGCLI